MHRYALTVFCVSLLLVCTAVGQRIRKSEVDDQSETFKHWWGTDLVWTFDDLPTEGSVAKTRIPYSGYIYPDRYGGTSDALRKYDRAFNSREMLPATNWEIDDTTGFKEPVAGVLGLLGVTDPCDEPDGRGWHPWRGGLRSPSCEW